MCKQPTTAGPAVRTKYDKMFEKKNQNILSEHYSSLIDHSIDIAKDDGDDFLTLKRADHAIDDLDAESTNAELSKRKLRLGTSKKAGLKSKGVASKLIFDEDGAAHELYEFVDEEEERAKKKGDEKEKFVLAQRGEMEVVDVEDREVAKDKKREMKRKRKEREREVNFPSFRSFVVCCLFVQKADSWGSFFCSFRLRDLRGSSMETTTTMTAKVKVKDYPISTSPACSLPTRKVRTRTTWRSTTRRPLPLPSDKSLARPPRLLRRWRTKKRWRFDCWVLNLTRILQESFKRSTLGIYFRRARKAAKSEGYFTDGELGIYIMLQHKQTSKQKAQREEQGFITVGLSG